MDFSVVVFYHAIAIHGESTVVCCHAMTVHSAHKYKNKYVPIPLTLCPTEGKRCAHLGGGCTRPWATTIVAGILAHCRVLSLVPAYEVRVCEWLNQRRGPFKTFHLHRNSARASTCGGAHGGKWNLRGSLEKEPSVLRLLYRLPPHTYTGRPGVGGHFMYPWDCISAEPPLSTRRSK